MFTPEEMEGRTLDGYSRTKKDGTVVSRDAVEDQGKLLALQGNRIIIYCHTSA